MFCWVEKCHFSFCFYGCWRPLQLSLDWLSLPWRKSQPCEEAVSVWFIGSLHGAPTKALQAHLQRFSFTSLGWSSVPGTAVFVYVTLSNFATGEQEHNVCSGKPRGKQDHDRRPSRNLVSLTRRGLIGRTIRRCSGMGTWCRHWAHLVSRIRHIASFSAEFRMSPHAVRGWRWCSKDRFFLARPWEQRKRHYKAQLLPFGYRISINPLWGFWRRRQLGIW